MSQTTPNLKICYKNKSKITCGPQHNFQHAMWPPEAREFDTPALQYLGRSLKIWCKVCEFGVGHPSRIAVQVLL